jgi:hypothetical protein
VVWGWLGMEAAAVMHPCYYLRGHAPRQANPLALLLLLLLLLLQLLPDAAAERGPGMHAAAAPGTQHMEPLDAATTQVQGLYMCV